MPIGSNQWYDGYSVQNVKRAAIDAASSGDNELVAAVTGKKIRVLDIVVVSAGSMTIRFESGAGGTALTGQMTVSAGSGFAPSFNPVGHFETASGDALNMELSGATSADGWLVYVEVDADGRTY